MPILSTTHCDIPEVVINNESGYLVPEKDTIALTNKLEYLVKHSGIWSKMGQMGRKHIEKNYDVVTQGQKLEEIYNHICF